MKAYEQYKSILEDDIIKDMQLDVVRWIDLHKLHKEFNTFWVNYDTDTQKRGTGYVLIDFAIQHMQKLSMIKEGS